MGTKYQPPSPSERFEIRAEIGRGSTGIVYRALDRELDNEVALKTLPSFRPSAIADLKREFRSLLGISHPNLIQLYELVIQPHQAFFTMELVEGTDLLSWVRGDLSSQGLLSGPSEQRFRIAARQLVDAIAFFHRRGKLHRDLKPSNVLVSKQGKLTVLDFGFSQQLQPETRYASTVDGGVGTPAYMAPEVLMGAPPDHMADWYSVGALLVEAWTGAPPPSMWSLEHTSADLLPELATAEEPLPLVARLVAESPHDRPDPIEICEQFGLATTHRGGRAGQGVQFTGRTDELEQLNDCVEALDDGDPIVACIRGVSGIGKTELVRRFAQEQENTGTLVFSSRCHHQETLPYKAFDGLLDQIANFIADSPEASRRYLIPRDLAAAGRLFPALAEIPEIRGLETPSNRESRNEPFELRRRAFSGIRELLRRIGDSHRLVLWIDDLQWADADSVLLLREILRRPSPPRMMLAASYRAEDAAAAEANLPLNDELLAICRIDVGPMPDSDAQLLVERAVGQRSIQGEHLQEILSSSAGVPLFLDQLARRTEAGGQSTRTPRGNTLESVIEERLQALPETARALLQVVSVAGQSIDREFALEVAGLEPSSRPVAQNLEAEALVRTRPTGGSTALETYHDRLREILVDRLDPVELRATHLSLAKAGADREEPDPNFLYRHYKGAAETELAGNWAVRAAEQADDSLAFLEAARLFEEAEGLLPGPKTQELVLPERRATALVNAGHCADAAPIFAATSQIRPKEAGLNLRRLATEQYLVSGHISQGVAELESLCRELGVPFPSTTTTALLRMLSNVARLRLQGLEFRETSSSDLPEPVLTAIDLCDSAGKGLVVVDPMRGLYFSFLSLVLALRAGEPRRIARGLCMGGASLSPISPIAAWGREMIRRVEQLGHERQDPYLLGLAQLALGQCLVIERDWPAVLENCDEGARTLEQGSRGTTWERNVGRMAALRALEELGEFTELRQRATDLLAEAEDQGDRYAQVVARQNLANWRLVAQDPRGARSAMRKALGLWDQQGFQMQHFYAGKLEVQCDLYEGDLTGAWKRFDGLWKACRRAGLLQHPTIHADALVLRARVAIANVAESNQVPQFRREAERSLRALRRFGTGDLEMHADLFAAGLAQVQSKQSPIAVEIPAPPGDELLVQRIARLVTHPQEAPRRFVFDDSFEPPNWNRWMATHFPGLNHAAGTSWHQGLPATQAERQQEERS